MKPKKKIFYTTNKIHQQIISALSSYIDALNTKSINLRLNLLNYKNLRNDSSQYRLYYMLSIKPLSIDHESNQNLFEYHRISIDIDATNMSVKLSQAKQYTINSTLFINAIFNLISHDLNNDYEQYFIDEFNKFRKGKNITNNLKFILHTFILLNDVMILMDPSVKLTNFEITDKSSIEFYGINNQNNNFLLFKLKRNKIILNDSCLKKGHQEITNCSN